MAKISKALRNKVWNTHIGHDKGTGECHVCATQISQQNFECGHVIAASLGGSNALDNLRPICGTCNKSMGQANMEEFKKKNFNPPVAITMKIIDIPVGELVVADLNVRKVMRSPKDETDIDNLADDIKANGLLNPLTVRPVAANRYEVIAGQRRLLAVRKLGVATVACNVMTGLDNKHAEEISLIENVQRNPMSIYDKIRAYNSVYKHNGCSVAKTMAAIHVSKTTLMRYVRLTGLPDEVLHMLDSEGPDKITIELATRLLEVPKDALEWVIAAFTDMSSVQKSQLVEEYLKDPARPLATIKAKVLGVKRQKVPKQPFVINDATGECVIIPRERYADVLKLLGG